MLLEIPTKYNIKYPRANERYYNHNKARKKLILLLLEASDEYCMYCGKDLDNDRDYLYHMEHSVDQNGNLNQKDEEETFLKHCKFNFSVACPKCNDDCKKIVKKINFLGKEKQLNCLEKICEDMCPEYYEVRNEYTQKNQIILQPLGMTVENYFCGIGYNLFKHFYEPLIKSNNPDSYFIAQNHILRFRLNDDRFSYCLVECAVDIVDLYYIGVRDKEKLIKYKKERRQKNIIGKLFVDFLEQMFEYSTVEQLIDFCEMIVVLESLY